nr:hypothetical protein [Bacillus pumilus]
MDRIAAGDIVYQLFAFGIPALILIGVAVFAIKKYKKKGQADR